MTSHFRRREELFSPKTFLPPDAAKKSAHLGKKFSPFSSLSSSSPETRVPVPSSAGLVSRDFVPLGSLARRHVSRRFSRRRAVPHEEESFLYDCPLEVLPRLFFSDDALCDRRALFFSFSPSLARAARG